MTRPEAPERLWVEAADGWSAGLAGVRTVRVEGARVLLELDRSVDDQVVLRAALAAGPVREFRRDRPSLLELFREAVGEPRVDANA